VFVYGRARAYVSSKGVDGVDGLYNPDVAAKPRAKQRGPWTAEEIARNERVARIRVERDRARGVSANMDEAVKLTRFANRFARAFRDARRA
jgi:hypothetical protein